MKLNRKLSSFASFAAAVIVLAALAVPSAFAGDDPRLLFDEAIRLRASEQTGVAAVTASGTQSAETARDLFARSADLFEDKAARDWRLWYEAGNARWWAGEGGRAIENYRRYLARDYFRGEVWENLAEARHSAQTQDPGREGFLAWPWPLWCLSAAALLAGFAALAFSLFLFLKKGSPSRGLSLHASQVFASIALAFALASAITYATRGKIAVIAKDTQGRKGDSSVYAVWPASPWKEGQEVFVAETRDTWTRIRVGKNVSWVPSDCLVVIDAE